ncbi:MAG: leucine-rich repeat domain-containing protein [Cytophagaceae bacterium]|nr:leucine-rich repeat domain-containing protein [Cytophagaceae bacterium]
MKTLIFIICLLPVAMQAQTYDPVAVAVVNNLIANNNLQATPSAPETWFQFTAWSNSSPKQLIGITLRNKGLTGFASFAGLAALEVLYCDYNELTGLDVTNCTNLCILDCTYNSLTELELATNAGLLQLECPVNNLTALDVANKTKLKILNCMSNDISELRLNNCPLLNELYCNGNNITELDISNFPQLKYLDCSSNRLTELHLSNLANLQKLDCGSNRLTELHPSNLTKLQKLYCPVNKLTELNLTGCTALQILVVSANQLANIDLSDLDNLVVFNGDSQSVYLQMEEDSDGNYIGYILLNNPVFYPPYVNVSYSNGVLKVASRQYHGVMFFCETGKYEFTLEGLIEFLYPQSNINANSVTNSLKAFVQNGMLHVDGLIAGETLSVFTVTGMLVYQGTVKHEKESITLNGVGGIYIVQSGKRTTKVVK